MLSHVCAEAELKMVNYAIENLSESLKELDSTSEEWFTGNQRRKELFRNKIIIEKERRNLLPAKVKNFEDKIAKLREHNRTNRPLYGNRTEITSNNLWRSLKVMEAWSGLEKAAIKKFIEVEREKSGDLTIATRNVWSSLPLRSDKPIVSLDLEVAAPLFYGSVDMGMASSIIEVGYIKITPIGEVSSDNYLCGVEAEYLETIGTGAVDVHNITLDMVKDYKPFSMDAEKQESLLRELRDCVLIAHNSDYEVSQLSSSLPGFAKLVEEGSIEILDTRIVVKHLIGGVESNTNEAFVEVTGGEYVGAHRALDDATMTLNALFRNKNLPEIAL